jgi:hypothetical protein
MTICCVYKLWTYAIIYDYVTLFINYVVYDYVLHKLMCYKHPRVSEELSSLRDAVKVVRYKCRPDRLSNMCILPSCILLLDNVHVSWPSTRISHLCKLTKWSYYFIKFTWISFNLIYMCVFFPRFYEKLTYVFYLLGSVKYLRRKLQSVYLLSSKK